MEPARSASRSDPALSVQTIHKSEPKFPRETHILSFAPDSPQNDNVSRINSKQQPRMSANSQ